MVDRNNVIYLPTFITVTNRRNISAGNLPKISHLYNVLHQFHKFPEILCPVPVALLKLLTICPKQDKTLKQIGFKNPMFCRKPEGLNVVTAVAGHG